MQKKHLELAEDSSNLVEEQRARTQLGRTYHEIFLKSENDHTALINAKKYLKSAMKLARKLKENPPCNTSSYYVVELIDAHNNIGLLEFDLDNMEEAEKILLQGLKICDNEEISEFEDTRSRLHNSLGRVYLELRDWNKARYHIERDIFICKQIGHSLGESKGYINLGEVNFRVQDYDGAIRCYHKARDIARTLEDERSLVDLIKSNVKTAEEAAKVWKEMIKDEQKLKKLRRTVSEARGTSSERKCLLEQYACLDSLIEKSCMILAWSKVKSPMLLSAFFSTSLLYFFIVVVTGFTIFNFSCLTRYYLTSSCIKCPCVSVLAWRLLRKKVCQMRASLFWFKAKMPSDCLNFK